MVCWSVVGGMLQPVLSLSGEEDLLKEFATVRKISFAYDTTMSCERPTRLCVNMRKMGGKIDRVGQRFSANCRQSVDVSAGCCLGWCLR